ncbi:asparagine synthetase domain-containing protein 1 isoform X1 [Juglans microcarpa x Juglans regia]|uniref:asparagine synthetase domain-containing protein 1 isoform X1 n=1 Tax=Juglans microcarpa x Juglans regia TaxID=2249226 RepID=UPI001B7E5FFF|nr:asparagine synthetase domain-containing protein 1 isoform X1 [Juglans microcarpa x Juglans regia]
MCGIALIISGIRICKASSLFLESVPPASSPKAEQLVFSIDDLKAALRGRGPDSLRSKKVFLYPNTSSTVEEQEIISFIEGEEEKERDLAYLQRFEKKNKCLFGADGEAHELENGFPKFAAELHFVGATLQLRGINPIVQPLVDISGNILVYNGEIFGGIYINSDSNDTEILLQALGKCCSSNSHLCTITDSCDEKRQSSIPGVLSAIKGPWAVIYWQESSKTLWFGRDAIGRRSLLVHWPTLEDDRFMLSSVSPVSSIEQSSGIMLGFEAENGFNKLKFWEELPCGIYSRCFGSHKSDGFIFGEVRKHEWKNAMVKELLDWERVSVEPKPEDAKLSHCKVAREQHGMHSAHSNIFPSKSGPAQASISGPAKTVLIALKESVMRRTSLHTIFQAVTCDIRQEAHAPVAVLFSGGLDSMILAALLDECLDQSYEIDLLNVSFDGQSAPDRISAKAGVKELRRIAPSRRWKLVEIDADLSKLDLETKHVMSLINPANTYMDLNIGIALWLAARGSGCVYEGNNNDIDEDLECVEYKSKARIVLVGSGADEQCAGYGRHKTKYRQGSWLGLHEEMKLDMQRIWKRNLGRDDRCIADNGKEARFPFLDEDVIRTLLDIPLWEVANLDQPSGTGDKKILREVAQLLGLYEASVLPKRAIQFGTRIARESNRKNFGSNRAANQASAGSAAIHMPSNLT